MASIVKLQRKVNIEFVKTNYSKYGIQGCKINLTLEIILYA
jgi:hypothetical protein